MINKSAILPSALMLLGATLTGCGGGSDSASNSNNENKDPVESGDTTAPVITLVGDSVVRLTVGDTYVEAGATAVDDVDGDISANITHNQISQSNTNTAGTYLITYQVQDAAGNAATEVTRTLIVSAAVSADTTAPVLTLLGDETVTLNVGDSYSDAGATASDDTDGDLSASITLDGTVYTGFAGTYVLTYSVTDAAGNSATPITRTVVVNPLTAPYRAAEPYISGTRGALMLGWSDVGDATYYKVYENSDGSSGYQQVGDDIAPGIGMLAMNVPLYERESASYYLSSCNSIGCTDSPVLTPSATDLNSAVDWVARQLMGYGELTERAWTDFGARIAMSADGNWLIIADHSAITNSNGANLGKLYVLQRTDNRWNKVWSMELEDASTLSKPAISANGAHIVIGIPNIEAPAWADINSNANGTGRLLVLERATTNDTITYSDISSRFDFPALTQGSQYGTAVGLAADYNEDGSLNTLQIAASAPGYQVIFNDDEVATINNTTTGGAIFVSTITRDGEAYDASELHIPCPDDQLITNAGVPGNTNPRFGYGMAMSADGSTIAVGLNPDNRPENLMVFRLQNGSATLIADENNTELANGDDFAKTLAVSDDGRVIASSAKVSYAADGRVYVYKLNQDGNLYQLSTSSITGVGSNIRFGYSLDLNSDGTVLAVGDPRHALSGIGISADASNPQNASESGTVYIFKDTDGVNQWSRDNIIKSVLPFDGADQAEDGFGTDLSISDNGKLAVGANNPAYTTLNEYPAVYFY